MKTKKYACWGIPFGKFDKSKTAQCVCEIEAKNKTEARRAFAEYEVRITSKIEEVK